ncbi:MAG: type II secretion system protein [Planctomycetes bacterium]|nr:type II secretion system protein [Planctomycetota bacterium]
MRTLKRNARCRRAGFTLVESLIAAAMLGIVLSAVGLTVLSGKEHFRHGMTAAALEGRTARLLDRIVAEVLWAGADTLPVQPTAPLGASEIEFRVCNGVVGGAQVWSGRTRIRLVPEPTDPWNGLDDDGDGVIDEGQVVLTRDLGGPDEVDVVLGGGVRRLLEGEQANALDDDGNGLVDEAGLSFVVQDGALTIRLSLEARDGAGRTLIRTAQTAVNMRN